MSAKRCVNCIAYSWPQSEDGAEEMKKCSKCKFVHYCSRQCQMEHWEKVGDSDTIADVVMFWR